jgi:Flp pilus assembly protein TadG
LPVNGLRDERGQALAEFVLVLPLLLALVTAIVQLGLAYNHWVTLTDAVRAGARVGAVSGSGAQIEVRNAVKTAANDLALTDSEITVVYSGGDVTVTARRQETLSIFGLTLFSPTLSSTTTERVES